MTTEIFYPVLVQVFLTLGLVLATGLLRVGAIRSGAVKPGDVALGQKRWPKRCQLVGNAYQNQLETPILFYAGVLFAGLFGVAGMHVLVVLAWVWVALRLIHVAIHVTTNHMLFRFLAFAASALALTGFWIVLALGVLTR